MHKKEGKDQKKKKDTSIKYNRSIIEHYYNKMIHGF